MQNLQGIGNFSTVFSLVRLIRKIFVWKLLGPHARAWGSLGLPPLYLFSCSAKCRNCNKLKFRILIIAPTFSFIFHLLGEVSPATHNCLITVHHRNYYQHSKHRPTPPSAILLPLRLFTNHCACALKVIPAKTKPRVTMGLTAEPEWRP